jgi:hypothetical protein
MILLLHLKITFLGICKPQFLLKLLTAEVNRFLSNTAIFWAFLTAFLCHLDILQTRAWIFFFRNKEYFNKEGTPILKNSNDEKSSCDQDLNFLEFP